jgi:Tfp pilus assembly protein PilX
MQCRDTVMRRLALRKQDPEGGVAMLLALMVILIVLSISIAVAGVTLSQVKPTQLDRKTVVTENAAEAGFDVALNRIRAAYSGTTVDPVTSKTYPAGSRTLLPCGPITGSVNGGATGDSAYTVTLLYTQYDPTTMTTSQRTAAALACTAGSGTAITPGFVTLTSTGTAPTIPGTRAGSGNRVIQTVYGLDTTNKNTPGGIIPFVATQGDCFAVNDSSAVKIGDSIIVAACDPASTPSAQQRWSYAPNLELQIASTNGTGTLCMQAVNTQYTKVVLAVCSPNQLPDPKNPMAPITPYQQIWSYNDNGQFQNSKTDDSGLGSYCLNIYNGTTYGTTTIAGLAIGDLIDLDTCSGGAQMIPDAKVGAGPAGSLRPFQITNYKYFGRCIDDTNQNVLATWLIGYPCKQDPNAVNLTWNQVYYTGISGGDGGTTGESASNGGSPGGNTVIATTAPASGCQISNVTPCQFITFPNGAGNSTKDYYCLEAGNSPNPSAPISGTIVTVQPCSTTDHYQMWTYTQAFYSNYAQQYLIQPYGASTSNLCLTMTVSASTPPGLTYSSAGGGTPIPAYGYIWLESCNSVAPIDLSQKWNAPPNPPQSLLKNTFEQPNP